MKADSGDSDERIRRVNFVRALEITVLVVAILYFGSPVLIPVAIAGLLTFLLTPVVDWFEARHIPRAAAVIVVATLICGLLGLMVWYTAEQFGSFVANLPTYQQNLHEKLRTIRQGEPEALAKLSQTVSDVTEEMTNQAAESRAAPIDSSVRVAEPANEPLPVSIVSPALGPFDALKTMVTSVAGPLATGGVVVVLTIFMLLTREELRNRVIRLAGTRQMSLTTRTFDEVSGRISSYLMMNAIVNGRFGLSVGLSSTFALLGCQSCEVFQGL